MDLNFPYAGESVASQKLERYVAVTRDIHAVLDQTASNLKTLAASLADVAQVSCSNTNCLLNVVFCSV